jgi:hypothetical protein
MFVAAIIYTLRRKDRSTATVLGAAWVAFLVASLFETPFGSLTHSAGTAMVGLLLGITMLPTTLPVSEGVIDTEKIVRLKGFRFAPQYVLSMLMFGIASCFMWATFHALHNRPLRTAQPIEASARDILAGRSGYLGDAKSPYTLVEFADYECPPCRANRVKVHDVLERYQGKLKLDFRNLPLPTLHPNAMYAAIVAEAARKQGKFWDTNSLLFNLKLSEPAIQKVVKDHLQAGILPTDLLGLARNAVEADTDLANQIGIEGTPGFLLCCPDGKVYRLQTPDSVSEIL